ncbi:MscL family protein [Nocardioides sp. NPDC057767]|uniref:MscL family protein n=1 Tax=unclassified Nocardioides TaxID=2615069 RepID=UPI00366BDE9B
MDGFKKFLLQGDLIKLAVAFIMGGAFATVVTATVDVIMDLLGKLGGTPDFSNYEPGGISIGAWLTAVIAFLIMASVVYFMIVKPYTAAKERYFPDPDPGETEIDILKQIRDSIAVR